MRDDRAASIGRPDYGGRPKVCPDGSHPGRPFAPLLFLYREDVVNLSRGRPIAFDYVGFEPDIHD